MTPQDVLNRAAEPECDYCRWDVEGAEPVNCTHCHGTGRRFWMLVEECPGICPWQDFYCGYFHCEDHPDTPKVHPPRGHDYQCECDGSGWKLRTATEGLGLEVAYELIPKDGYVVMARGEAVIVGEATIHGDKRYAGYGDTPLEAIWNAVTKVLELEPSDKRRS